MPALSAVRNRVHIYSFNIPENTLKKAYDLLDKELERRSMKFAKSFLERICWLTPLL